MRKFLSADEISTALGVHRTTITRRAANEGWQTFGKKTQGGRNGQKVVYSISLLPQDLKTALANSGLLPAVAPGAMPPALEGPQVSEPKKALAMAKYDLLRHYMQSVTKTPWGVKDRAREEFMAAYNSGIIFPKLFEALGTLSWKTIEGWKVSLKKNRGDTHCLADRRGYSRNGATSLTLEQQGILRTFAYHPNKLKISHAVTMARKVMEHRGIDTHSPATYGRYIQSLCDDDYPLWVFCREGEQALEKKCGYTIKRDYDKINVGDVVTADGKTLNFNILNPWDGKPCRMKLILWYDMKSSYPLGWEIMPTENTQAINSALRRAILALGKIPLIAYVDNGKAFRAEHFTKCEDLSQAGLAGIYAKLGMETIFAWPYHGQSKTVERFFGNMLEIESILPTYVGNSINNKPARTHRGEKLHNALWERAGGGKIVITMEQAHEIIAAWFDDYAMRPQGRNSHLAGQRPHDVFVAGRGPGVDELALRELMMSVQIKTVRKTGIRLFGQDYYHPALYGRRHPVLVRYDQMDISLIYIYEESGEFLCEAGIQPMAHPAAKIGTDEDRRLLESELALKQHLKKQTVGFAREMLKNNILPEHQRMLALQGITDQSGSGSMNEKKPVPVKLDEAKIAAQVARITRDTENDEAVQMNRRLEEAQDGDRYDLILQMEAQGQLVPKRWRSWRSYYEETPEYRRDEDYWESRRTAYAVMYQSEAGSRS